MPMQTPELQKKLDLLFAKSVRDDFKVPSAWVALHSKDGHVTPEMVSETGAFVLFGGQKDLTLWDSCVRRELGEVETWRFAGSAEEDGARDIESAGLENVILPLALVRGSHVHPPGEGAPRKGDVVIYLIFSPKRQVDQDLLQFAFIGAQRR